MRISDAEVTEIIRILSCELKARPFDIYLYGSRVDDRLHGGDIDLFILSEKPWAADEEKKLFYILGQLQSSPIISDRKINLSLIEQTQLASDPFWVSIKNKIKLATVE
jgi:predicted nucleotidyltransferase